MSLRVGIDARHLSSKNNGIRTYLLNLLLSSIKKTKNTHEWFILSPYYFDSDFLNFENVKIIKMPISTKFMGFHIFFTQIIIPVLSLLNVLGSRLVPYIDPLHDLNLKSYFQFLLNYTQSHE